MSICKNCSAEYNLSTINFSAKQTRNNNLLSVPPNICMKCYHEYLSSQIEPLKEELKQLNKQKEITQAAYYEAYNAWKEKAELFAAIDYNLSINKHNKKEKKKRAENPQKDPINVELMARNLLAQLTLTQQEEILKRFKNFNASSIS